MKNIVLVGFMGTGKTVVGRAVAERLRRELVQTDYMIEEREATPINEIFARKGEPYFRQVERKIIKEVSKREDVVIDAGGGAIIDEDNVKDLKANGVIFCLNAAPEEILRRTVRYTHRPLLNVKDPLAEINKLLARRREYYKRADYQIKTDGKDIDKVAQDVIAIYNKTNRKPQTANRKPRTANREPKDG